MGRSATKTGRLVAWIWHGLRDLLGDRLRGSPGHLYVCHVQRLFVPDVLGSCVRNMRRM